MNNAANKYYNGGAIYSAYGRVSISNCYFSDNRAGSGGALATDNTDLVVEDCRFVNNVSEKGYGGGIRTGNSVVVVSNTYFGWNQGASYGGGIAAVNSSSLIVNSTFMGNSVAVKGGGAIINKGDVIIASCTFSRNKAGCKGGAVAGLNLDPSYMTNSILYGDSLPEIYSEGGYPAATFCNIRMTSGIYNGEGNINEDPLFAEPAAGDLHLLPASPCIDAGDMSVDLLLNTDIDGNPRVLNDWIDIGSDEVVVN